MTETDVVGIVAAPQPRTAGGLGWPLAHGVPSGGLGWPSSAEVRPEAGEESA